MQRQGCKRLCSALQTNAPSNDAGERSMSLRQMLPNIVLPVMTYRTAYTLIVQEEAVGNPGLQVLLQSLTTCSTS